MWPEIKLRKSLNFFSCSLKYVSSGAISNGVRSVFVLFICLIKSLASFNDNVLSVLPAFGALYSFGIFTFFDNSTISWNIFFLFSNNPFKLFSSSLCLIVSVNPSRLNSTSVFLVFALSLKILPILMISLASCVKVIPCFLSISSVTCSNSFCFILRAITELKLAIYESYAVFNPKTTPFSSVKALNISGYFTMFRFDL